MVNPDLPTLFISVLLSYVLDIITKRQSSLSFNSTSISFSSDFNAASIALSKNTPNSLVKSRYVFKSKLSISLSFIF